jgi:hypothetical protein
MKIILFSIVCIPLLFAGCTGMGTSYDTDIGTLKKGDIVIESGAEINFTTNGMEIIFGFVKIQEGQAVSLNEGLEVFAGHKRMPEPSITLVQDKATGKWLATGGVLATAKQKFGLVEGHIVKIIGGTRDPIKIEGYSFANSVIIIREGKPVEQKTESGR